MCHQNKYKYFKDKNQQIKKKKKIQIGLLKKMLQQINLPNGYIKLLYIRQATSGVFVMHFVIKIQQAAHDQKSHW